MATLILNLPLDVTPLILSNVLRKINGQNKACIYVIFYFILAKN